MLNVELWQKIYKAEKQLQSNIKTVEKNIENFCNITESEESKNQENQNKDKNREAKKDK